MTIPLSLYIHTPWCVRKCPYCDFNSHALSEPQALAPDNQLEAQYLNRLITEIKQKQSLIEHREIQTIFIGGGTPSLMSAAFYEKLFNAIYKELKVKSSAEITMEANPGTFEQTKFSDFYKIGINRLSIGIQSFNAQQLKNLGRIHNDNEAKKAVEIAKQAGFENINLDLMHGLPNQTIQEALDDLQTGINFQPNHISWYQLTLEPNTLFHAKPPKLPQHDLMCDMQDQGQALLNENAYEQYEVSAYAKNKNQCEHNLNYWRFGDYLGIGAGAHSKLTLRGAKRRSNLTEQGNSLVHKLITRHWNYKNPRDYLNKEKNFIANEAIISQQELPFEYMLNHLRLMLPVEFSHFEKSTTLNRSVLNDYLKEIMEFIRESENGFALNDRGKNYLNDVLQVFLS